MENTLTKYTLDTKHEPIDMCVKRSMRIMR